MPTNADPGQWFRQIGRRGGDSRWHAFIDRQLYLPKAWTSDAERRAAAHVPEAVRFATKPETAAGMISRAVTAGVPFAWATGDWVYGASEVGARLSGAGKGYVLGVTSDHHFWWGRDGQIMAATAAEIVETLKPSDWQQLSAGTGTKGERLYDWAYYVFADVADATGSPGLWTRGLLIRRPLDAKDLAFFATWCPAGTPLETLVKVEGSRWAIEDAFECTKTELGLDHNETRSWHGWHRHVSLVMLALAMMAAVRHRANRLPPARKKGDAERIRRWCAGLSRKSAA